MHDLAPAGGFRRACRSFEASSGVPPSRTTAVLLTCRARTVGLGQRRVEGSVQRGDGGARRVRAGASKPNQLSITMPGMPGLGEGREIRQFRQPLPRPTTAIGARRSPLRICGRIEGKLSKKTSSRPADQIRRSPARCRDRAHACSATPVSDPQQFRREVVGRADARGAIGHARPAGCGPGPAVPASVARRQVPAGPP